jgi:hypothetical protein
MKKKFTLEDKINLLSYIRGSFDLAGIGEMYTDIENAPKETPCAWELYISIALNIDFPEFYKNNENSSPSVDENPNIFGTAWFIGDALKDIVYHILCIEFKDDMITAETVNVLDGMLNNNYSEFRSIKESVTKAKAQGKEWIYTETNMSIDGKTLYTRELR